MIISPPRTRALLASLATAAVLAAPLAAPADAAAPFATSAANAGVIPFTAADVTRIGGSDWTVSWAAPAGVTSVQVYVGSAPDTFPAQATVTDSHATGAVTITSASRPWIKLVPSYGAPLVLTARSLDLAEDPNLRDAGGYRTVTGQWVKEGVVLRGQEMSTSLSSATKAALDGLGLTTVYDFRTTAEVTSKPDYVPAGATRVSVNVLGDGTSVTTSNLTSPADAVELMKQAEIMMVDAPSAVTSYQTLFHGIQSAAGPSLYHCTAGKDRTGWASAALLTLLGVPADTVMKDYLLSNEYYFKTTGTATLNYVWQQTHDGYLAQGATEAAATAAADAAKAIYTPMMEVRAEYLQAGLDRVAQEYGTIEGYFTKGLGFTASDIAALRAKLLTGSPIPSAGGSVSPHLVVGAPRIKGKGKVGSTLSGLATRPAGATLSYQWLANGRAIRGATKARLRVTKSLKGKKVALRITAATAGAVSASATSRSVRIAR
ncbi:tyrosine-protein phosphatase [Nocardioides sp. Kera G14]|uniref:tyrosine-protein phosphatase n=1 Tax=Nocardioides sp. Kera G14 TaxID=2884264 RepID=UPI001D1158E3|nr:tyrosine-protein phosphatase [Nocardioides sp. Kera G14]UDY25254.1 tyrosine-protein phosphatase [Nocardioides sp. Kera G14]